MEVRTHGAGGYENRSVAKRHHMDLRDGSAVGRALDSYARTDVLRWLRHTN